MPLSTQQLGSLLWRMGVTVENDQLTDRIEAKGRAIAEALTALSKGRKKKKKSRRI